MNRLEKLSFIDRKELRKAETKNQKQIRHFKVSPHVKQILGMAIVSG